MLVPTEAAGEGDTSGEGALLPIVRFIYRGESLRNGRVCQLPADAVRQDPRSGRPFVSGDAVLAALAGTDANVDLGRFRPLLYSKLLEGWVDLHAATEVALHRTEQSSPVRRAEVMLEVKQPTSNVPSDANFSLAAASAAVVSAGGAPSAGGSASGGAGEAGYFGIGIYNSKSAENVGTLWRSAFQLGATYIYTIGARNGWEKTADTCKAWTRIPAFRFANWGAFCATSPFAAEWVAVEMGGTPLEDFEHPERCVYVLGAEDAGLPASIVRACAHCVSLGALREESYNVAVAGSLVMYDRLRKRRARVSSAGVS